MSDQLQAPAALPPVKLPTVPIEEEAGCSLSRSVCCPSAWNVTPDHAVCSVVLYRTRSPGSRYEPEMNYKVLFSPK